LVDLRARVILTDELQASLADREKALADAASREQGLRIEIERIREKAGESMAFQSELAGQHRAAIEDLRAREKDLRTALESANAKAAQVDGLRSEIDGLRADAEAALKRESKLSALLEESHVELALAKSYQSEVAEQRAKIEQYRLREGQWQAELEAARSEWTALAEELESSQKALSEVRANAEALQANKSQTSTLEAEISALRSKLGRQRGAIAWAQASRQHARQLEEDLERLASAPETHSRLTESDSRLADSLAALEATRAEAEVQRAEAARLSNLLVSTEGQTSETHSRLTESESRLADAEARLTESLAALETTRAEAEAQRAEAARLANLLVATEGQTSKTHDRLTESESRLADAEARLTESLAALEATRAEAEVQRSEAARLANLLASTEGQTSETHSRLTESESRLADAEARLTEALAALEVTRAEAEVQRAEAARLANLLASTEVQPSAQATDLTADERLELEELRSLRAKFADYAKMIQGHQTVISLLQRKLWAIQAKEEEERQAKVAQAAPPVEPAPTPQPFELPTIPATTSQSVVEPETERVAPHRPSVFSRLGIAVILIAAGAAAGVFSALLWLPQSPLPTEPPLIPERAPSAPPPAPQTVSAIPQQVPQQAQPVPDTNPAQLLTSNDPPTEIRPPMVLPPPAKSASDIPPQRAWNNRDGATNLPLDGLFNPGGQFDFNQIRQSWNDSSGGALAPRTIDSDIPELSPTYDSCRELAESGDPAMQYLLGLRRIVSAFAGYRNGTDARDDLREAYVWLQKAARAGNPDALYVAGQMRRLGIGCREDADKGRAVIAYAAAAGQPDALEFLGVEYLNLHFQTKVTEYAQKAFENFEGAARRGRSLGELMAGRMLTEGLGCRQDVAAGVPWLVKAFRNGKPEALDYLRDAATAGSEKAATALAELDPPPAKPPVADPFVQPDPSDRPFSEP